MNPGDTLVRAFLAVLSTVAAGADDPAKERAGRAELIVRGRVTDARDQRPIPRFQLVPARDYGPNGRLTWQPHLLKKYEQGRYEYQFERAWDRTRFRVVADGYRPAISRVVKNDEWETTIDFPLERDPGISGMVRNAEGAPVAGARVTFSTVTNEVHVSGGRLEVGGLGSYLGAVAVETGADGTFRLPAESDAGTIVAAHERHGYAEVSPDLLAETGDVTLRPWGRVEGRLLLGDTPLAGRRVTLGSIRPFGMDHHTIQHSEETTTDAAGRFVFERVAPGRAFINRSTKTKDGWASMGGTLSWIEVLERGTTRLTLGGPGRAVVGRLTLPPGKTGAVDWSRFSVKLGPDAPHIGLPGDDEIWAAFRRFANSDEGKPYFREVSVTADGSFRIEGVPQGRYKLVVRAIVDPASKTAIHVVNADVEVPPTPDGRGDPIDLGDLQMRNIDALPD